MTAATEPDPQPPALADPQLARWLAEVRANPGPSCAELGASELRAGARRRAASRPPGPDLHVVADMVTDGGIPVRLYRPGPNLKPLVIFLHGGGFVIGDLHSHDAICRRLSRLADVTVLAVDYRRSPEDPGPAAVDDAVAAHAWAAGRLRELGGSAVDGIGLAGDSAGGAIAALAAVELTGRAAACSALLLLYPNADMTLSSPSITTKGSSWDLEAADLSWFVEQWVPNPSRRTDPTLSPLHAPLAGLPPTMLITAEHDPLRDEGESLAEALRSSGVSVIHHREPGLVHGFLGLSHFSPAAERTTHRVFTDFGRFLRQA